MKRKPLRYFLRKKSRKLFNESFRLNSFSPDGPEEDKNIDELLAVDLNNAFEMAKSLNVLNEKEKLESMNFIRNSLYKFPFDFSNQEESEVLGLVLGHISPSNSFYIRRESLLFLVNLLKYNPQAINRHPDLHNVLKSLCCILNEKNDLIDATLFCFTIITKTEFCQNTFRNLADKLLNLSSWPLTNQQVNILINLIETLLIQPQAQSNYLIYFRVFSNLLNKTEMNCQQQVFIAIANYSNLESSKRGIVSVIEIVNICKRFIFNQKSQKLILMILNDLCAGENYHIEVVSKSGILDQVNEVYENIDNDSLKIILFMLSNIASVDEFQREIILFHPIFDKVLKSLKIGPIEVKIEASYVVRNIVHGGKFEYFFEIDYKFDPGSLIKNLGCNNEELCLNLLEILKVYCFNCNMRIDLKDHMIEQIELIRTKNKNLLKVIEEIYNIIKYQS